MSKTIIIFYSRSGTIDVHEFQSLWQYIQQWKSCFDGYVLMMLNLLVAGA